MEFIKNHESHQIHDSGRNSVLIERCDTALYISEMVSEVFRRMNTEVPSPVNIEALTDNQSLFDTIHSTKQTSEKCLIVYNSAVRQM